MDNRKKGIRGLKLNQKSFYVSVLTQQVINEVSKISVVVGKLQ